MNDFYLLKNGASVLISWFFKYADQHIAGFAELFSGATFQVLKPRYSVNELV